MRIEKMNQSHFSESMMLTQFAFQMQKTDEEIEEIKLQFETEPADRYAAYVENQFAAQMTVLGLDTFIGGKRFAMGGISAVATWPEYRRQGLVAKLLVHALKEMKEKGQTVSFLHPFSFGFYRKYGWETYTENKVYTIKTEQLPVRKAFDGRIERCKAKDYSLLETIYEKYAIKFNGTLARTELWWSYRISKRKPGQSAIYYDQNGEAQGYIIYEIKNMHMSVHELVYLNEGARSAIWSFISQHDSMFKEMTITVPSNDKLAYTLPDPRIKQETFSYFMARIVDAEAFIGQYMFSPDEVADQIPIQIVDEHAPWNNGSYSIEIEPSGNAILKRLDEIKNNDFAIKVNIGVLTSLLFGYIRPLELARLAQIQGDEEVIKRLHVRIPERTTYLPDFF